MHDNNMQSRTELVREIQLTDWSTAGEQGKLVFVVSIKPLLAQFITLFTAGKNCLSILKNYTSIQVFHFKISVKTKFVLMNTNFITNICNWTGQIGQLSSQ